MDPAEAHTMGSHPLDNATYAALTGPHAHLAEIKGGALRYPVDVAAFVALPHRPDASAWADLEALAGPGAQVGFGGAEPRPPEAWEFVRRLDGVQYVDEAVRAAPDPEAVELGPEDLPAMLELVARTEPGPFRPRALELGTYLGLRRNGELVAMAGERVHPPGWTEISAVCTDPGHRGQGLAARLIRAVAAGIRARGETPFLHVAASNLQARRLYERLGFRERRRTAYTVLRTPGSGESPPDAGVG